MPCERNPIQSAASAPPKSAALAPQDPGFLTRSGGPIRPPAWIPEDVDFHNMPEAVRQAVADLIEPAYRRLVAEAEDPLERSVGMTIVHLMWLEILQQHEVMQDYLQTAILNLRQDRGHMIDQHLRTLHTKVKVGHFLSRLRELRGRSDARCQVSGVRCQVSGVRCQRRVCGQGVKNGGANVKNAKIDTQKLNVKGRKSNDERKSECPTSNHPPGGANVKNAKIDTQKIEARFEQVRTQIVAHAAFFVANGSVEATWRTYRGQRLGPYFRVRCRQRSGRRAAGAGAAARPASIYLGRSPELAARVGKLLDDLQQHTRCKRRCEELHRQVRRSLAGAKQELRRLLAGRGAVQRWFERNLRASGNKSGRSGGVKVGG